MLPRGSVFPSSLCKVQMGVDLTSPVLPWSLGAHTACRVQSAVGKCLHPRAKLSEEKLSQKIEQELSELRIASSESVSREEEKKEEKRLETENFPKDVRSCLEEDREATETEKVKNASPWLFCLFV